MSAPFGAGHSRLFGCHAGLGSAWQRAAQAERHGAARVGGDRRGPGGRRGASRHNAARALSAVAVLGACLLPWLLLSDEPVAEAGVAAPVVTAGAPAGG